MKRVGGGSRLWGRWILLGVCSCGWIWLILFAFGTGRGGISFLAGETGARKSIRPTEKADLWAEAFMAGEDAGWEWMIVKPVEMRKSEDPGEAGALKEKIRLHARKGVSSTWLDWAPGLLPLRRKVQPDGSVVAELLASTVNPNGAELMGNLVAARGGTIKNVGANQWQATLDGITLLCQWRESTGAVTETKSGQVRGWLLVRPGLEESSRP